MGFVRFKDNLLVGGRGLGVCGACISVSPSSLLPAPRVSERDKVEAEGGGFPFLGGTISSGKRYFHLTHNLQDRLNL